MDIIITEPAEFSAEILDDHFPLLELKITVVMKCPTCQMKLQGVSESANFIELAGVPHAVEVIFSRFARIRECADCGTSSVFPRNRYPAVKPKLDDLALETVAGYYNKLSTSERVEIA